MLCWDKLPRPAGVPRRSLPPQACDCHIHISDASGRFPVRRATHPPLHATPEACREMFHDTGLQRAVAVQLMAYGGDNEVMLEALRAHPGALRGIAELSPDVSDNTLETLHAAGVRGLRFYLEPPRAIPGLEVSGAGLEDLRKLAPRMRSLGWVAELSAGCDLIVRIAPMLQALGLSIVLEHMAGCTAARGIFDPAVRQIIALLETGVVWIKLTVCAMSELSPEYRDLRPIHDAFVAAAPDRMLWGSNWPHAMPHGKSADSGKLLDLLDTWLEHDERLRTAILCDNPARLFDFR